MGTIISKRILIMHDDKPFQPPPPPPERDSHQDIALVKLATDCISCFHKKLS